MDAYKIMWIPGMGLSLICDACNGDDRDLLTFETYTDNMDLLQIMQLVETHEFERHQMGRWKVP